MKILNILSGLMILLFAINLFLFVDIVTNKDIITMLIFMCLHIVTRLDKN